MSGPLFIPPETERQQKTASDPARSAWVSANAGSGKTHVLAQRVIRLLLDGTDPARILCLTYTRAAAANMAERVFKTLAGWAMLPEAELAAAIADVDGRMPARGRLRAARRLFARALETPGGLKIQTIHAFCEAVLHRFPLEANIAAHFELMDAQMEAALVAEARRDMLTSAGGTSAELGAAFAQVLEQAGESGLDGLLSEIVGKREALRRFIDALGQETPPFAALRAEFGFGPHETEAGIAAGAWPLPGFSPSEFAAFAQAAAETGAGAVLNNILPHASLAFEEADPVRRLELLRAGFLKKDGDPYGQKQFKQALLARLPDLLDRYALATQALRTACERLARLRMVDSTRAALVIADWLIRRYEQLKNGRGLLDFNDLITRTARLLLREDAGAWVRYKLDRGVDHILIDEAQDTSPEQWAVVLQLADDFFSGAGAQERTARTVFAVGDEKQSIYSFQGARPQSFAETRAFFSARVREAEAMFDDVRLKWSFRSTQDVLTAVDHVFADPQARRGLSQDDIAPEHKAIRAGAPGCVEVWPSIAPQAIEEPDDWAEPIDHATAPAVQLAEEVAATIAGWLEKPGERLEASGRPIAAGDIMVLVRKRDRFMHALSRALKNRHVPVAGADRLDLAAHIAVKDLVALGRFLLQPQDDLSLAALLRSPVFGLSDDALYALASGRGARPLSDTLRAADGMAEVAKRLEDWTNEAARLKPHDFYARLLSRDGLRAKIVARLGHEAGDILDEFLNFCLAEERVGLPGLQALLSTLESGGPQIRREMDRGRGEVRIMTVHAAKGLEAPVVFLVDSGSAPAIHAHLPKLMPFEPKTVPGPGLLWRPGKADANEVSRAAEARELELAEDEYRRLLYVGMTRAEDRLVVCGYQGKRGLPAGSWHDLVARALGGRPETAEDKNPFTGRSLQRFRLATAWTPEGKAEEAPSPVAEEPLPAALLEKMPPEPMLPRPLSPSGAIALIEPAAGEAVRSLSPVLDATPEPSAGIVRGRIFHKLLQSLPDIAPQDRLAAGARYLARAAADWNGDQRAAALASVLSLLEEPRFASLFSPSSRAEVAIMGEVEVSGRLRAVSGTIDRLAVTDEAVLIVDYKTDRPPAQKLSDVPEGYILQLALYRALVAAIYPSRAVRAVLLFTEGPFAIELPEPALQEALARLARA